ncbi:MAG: DUF4160 domain-containing protein [Magnetococcales bacterium]|nr:DUF4160 domain-containing protein [Magnetococcales bacterium]NGZ06012.1 DUF4160 domain-containing protein [Magnetococcales bacterium]
MPTISYFYGISIRMFLDDHAPPHFHASYGGFTATIDIQALKLLKGELPRRALELVLDWAELHQKELLHNWELCHQWIAPNRIDPLT